MAEFDQNLTVDELKAIIQGLRMSGFSFVEPEALSQIQFRIKNLPVGEEMDKLADDPVSIKNIVHEIGELMRLLEIYGSKNSEYKARFQSLKGLPPRYKVLEWRNKKAENNMNIKTAEIAKELVRLSSEMDEKGQTKISQKMIVCAKCAMDDQFGGKDFQELDTMMKEAGFMDVMKGVGDVAKGVGQAVKQKVTDTSKAVGNAVGNAVQVGKETFQVGKYQAALDRINKELLPLSSDLLQASKAAVDPARKQKLEQMYTKLSNMLTVGKELYKLTVDPAQTQQAPATAPEQAPVQETAPEVQPAAAPAARQPPPMPADSQVPAANVPAEKAPATPATPATTDIKGMDNATLQKHYNDVVAEYKARMAATPQQRNKGQYQKKTLANKVYRFKKIV